MILESYQFLKYREFKNKTQIGVQGFFKGSLNFGWRQHHGKIWMKHSVYSLFLPIDMHRF